MEVLEILANRVMVAPHALHPVLLLSRARGSHNMEQSENDSDSEDGQESEGSIQHSDFDFDGETSADDGHLYVCSNAKLLVWLEIHSKLGILSQ